MYGALSPLWICSRLYEVYEYFVAGNERIYFLRLMIISEVTREWYGSHVLA